MFRSPALRRRGGALFLLLGLVAGCRHAPRCACCPAPAGVLDAGVDRPALDWLPEAGPSQPERSPLVAPPIRNERYVPPPRTLPPPEELTPPLRAPEQVRARLLAPVPDPDVVDSIRLPTIVGQPDGPARRSFPDITARPEFGHTPDHTFLTGELSYNAQKDQWRLRYAAIGEEDRYGGSVTLDAGHLMQGFRSGQMVTVQGEPIDRRSREPSPLYRLKSITALKR